MITHSAHTHTRGREHSNAFSERGRGGESEIERRGERGRRKEKRGGETHVKRQVSSILFPPLPAQTNTHTHTCNNRTSAGSCVQGGKRGGRLVCGKDRHGGPPRCRVRLRETMQKRGATTAEQHLRRRRRERGREEEEEEEVLLVV